MKKIISVLLAIILLFTSVGISATVSAASTSGAPKKITISKTSKTVYIGQKYKLKVTSVSPKTADDSVKWKTSDKKIATVDKNGVVTGKKSGTVTITATSKKNSKIKAKCKVKVKKFKNTTISYKSKVYACEPELCKTNGNPETHDDPHIIKTYDQLKELKKSIKKYYDISGYYGSRSTWNGDEEYAEKQNGDEILEMLDKYNKKFFEKNALYYNCIDFTTEVDNENYTYSFKCNKVEKKISSDGKLTCYMHIERKIKKITEKKKLTTEYDTASTIDYDTAVYFIELKKDEIKGVQDFRLKHYGYFDLNFISAYL